MKKLYAVAVAVAVCVGSAFASWDYFPPKEAGKGEAKLGIEYGIDQIGTPMGAAKDWSNLTLSVGARYSIIEGLEASVILPIPTMLSYKDCDDCGEDYAGLSYPEIGVRYWLPMGLGFFVDAKLPVDTREDSKYWVAMELGVGAQFSTNFTEELSLGSQLGLTVPFANSESKRGEGMGLGVGIELDYAIGSVTPFLGFDASFGITKPTYDGKEIEGADPAKPSFDISIGASFSINDAMGADVSFKLGIGEDYKYYDGGEKDFMPMTIGAHFSYNF